MGEDERKLFVGKLPSDIQKDEIQMVFNTYGRVVDVYLIDGTRQKPGQEPQRCAFVTYETSEAAKVAMQVLNDVYRFREDSPEPVNVSVALPRGGKGSGDDRGGNGFGRGGVGKGFGHGTGYDRGHDDFRGGGKGPSYDRPPPHYDRGGGAHSRGPPGGYDRGGGYDRQPAHGYDRGGGNDRGGQYKGPDRGGYDRGGYDRDRGKDYGGGKSGGKGGGKGGFGGKGGSKSDVKLYIGNLPDDITREAIDMVFGTYGRVEDIHIMTGRSRSGQACAFVTYSSPGEAKSAIHAMEAGYEIRPGEGHILVKAADDKDGGDRGRDRGGGGDRYRPY